MLLKITSVVILVRIGGEGLLTKASSFKSIYSKSIKASKMRKRETIHKLLGLLLVMAVALAAWALPLSIHSPTEAQVGSTSVSVVPSQVSVDVTQAEFFNVSV